MKRNASFFTLIFLVLSWLASTGSTLNRPAKAQSAAPSRSTSWAHPQSTQPGGDPGWPRGYSLPNEAQIILHQPQVAVWEGQKHMVALAAVSYVAKGEPKPSMGVLKIEADTSVSLE